MQTQTHLRSDHAGSAEVGLAASALAAPRAGGRRTLFFVRRESEAHPAQVVALVSTAWTGFLRQRAGLPPEPFFEREALPDEPDHHANGHPFAWLYREPRQSVLDEVRLMTPLGEAGLASAARYERELEAALERLKPCDTDSSAASALTLPPQIQLEIQEIEEHDEHDR